MTSQTLKGAQGFFENKDNVAKLTSFISQHGNDAYTFKLQALEQVMPDTEGTDSSTTSDEQDKANATSVGQTRIAMLLESAGGSYINAECWLPEPANWNGIFIGMGSGGIGSYMNTGGLRERSAEGYAAAYSDLGTSQGSIKGENNPAMWIDFGGRATHLTAVIGQYLTEEIMGAKPDFRYFEGASTGGQQALREAQDYPEDYDGIIAGVPANNRTYLHSYFLWCYQILYREGRKLFTKDEIENIYQVVTSYINDHGDREPADAFVYEPGRFAPEDHIDGILDAIAKTEFGLSDEQRQALRAVYIGPKHALTGEKIYGGIPFGSEVFGCGIDTYQENIEAFDYPFRWAFGNDYDVMSFDFGKDFDELNKRVGAPLNAVNPDLTPFLEKGGKLLMFSGSSDGCVPFHEALKYYHEVVDTVNKGGSFSATDGDNTVSATDAGVRYFIFPGRDHGWGGRGINAMIIDGKIEYSLLSLLRSWREKGLAPNEIEGARVSETKSIEFTRTIYPL